MVSVFSRKAPAITDDSAWHLWTRGKIDNSQLAAYLAERGISKITRNWGTQILHIKTFTASNLRPSGNLASCDIDGKDEDLVIRFDLLVPELENKGIRVWKEEGLRDAPKWRLKMLGKPYHAFTTSQ